MRRAGSAVGFAGRQGGEIGLTVHVTSGPGRVIASGMVTALWGHDLVLHVAHGPAPFQVTLGWVSDPSVRDVEVRTAWPAGGIRFDLVNFDAADGRGTAEPVLLTEAGEDLVFLHFRVFRFGNTTDRTVHYTVFAVAKDAIGWRPVVSDEAGG